MNRNLLGYIVLGMCSWAWMATVLRAVDWSITNPGASESVAATIYASGMGPLNQSEDLLLFAWNGGSYVSWGYANPAQAQTDGVLGDWVSQLYPESGGFYVNDYRLTIGFNPIEASQYFSLTSP